MAAVVRRDTTAPSTTGGTTFVSASFTPVAGELLAVVFCHSGSSTALTPTMTGSANGMTFTRVEVGATTVSAGMITGLFLSDQLVPGSPVAMTVTITHGFTSTGNHLVVLGVSGMTQLGTAAKRQSANTGTTHVAGATPAVTMGAAALTTNPVIAWGANLTGTTTTLTPPASFTERYDNFYSTPTQGFEVASRDSGHTSATVTAGSTMTGGIYSAAELDASVASAEWPIIVQPPRR